MPKFHQLNWVPQIHLCIGCFFFTNPISEKYVSIVIVVKFPSSSPSFEVFNNSKKKNIKKSSFFNHKNQQQSFFNHHLPGPSISGASHGSVKQGVKIHHPLGFFIGTPTGRCWYSHPSIPLKKCCPFASFACASFDTSELSEELLSTLLSGPLGSCSTGEAGKA